jgi:hypothetical protein
MLITGDRDTRRIAVDGRRLSPVRSQRLFNHSPDGFAWGYEGSGPAQLALALLLHAGVGDRLAVALHQRFKREVIARLPVSLPFALDIDITAWVERNAERAC